MRKKIIKMILFLTNNRIDLTTAKTIRGDPTKAIQWPKKKKQSAYFWKINSQLPRSVEC